MNLTLKAFAVIALAAATLAATAQAAVISSATTAREVNLAASTSGGDPNSNAWFFGTNYFSSYGPLTAVDWNSGNTFSLRAGSILQWNLTGFTNSGDAMGTVSNATFTIMTVNGVGPVGNPYTNVYKIYRLIGAIDGTTTWNSKPLLDTSAYVTFTATTNYSLQTIDVSSLLAKNGGLTTFGVAVLLDSGAGGENLWSTAYNQWPAYTSHNKLSASYTVQKPSVTIPVTNSPTAREVNLAASTSGGGSPTSTVWWGGTNVFENYGSLTAVDWNSGNTFPWRAGSILQWNLTGFTNSGDTMGNINGATITILPKDGVGPVGNPYTNVYKIYRLTGAFDGTTTWNSKPLLDTNTFVSFAAGTNYTLKTIDVSSLLANNGGMTTFGVAVLLDSGAGNDNFWSTAYGASWPALGAQNKLTADYVLQNPTINNLTWNNAAGNGIWSTTAANWAPAYAWSQGANAVFGATGAGTVNVDGAVTVKNITFNAIYNITDTGIAGTLTLIGGSTITVGTGFSATISESLAGTNGFTKDGTGTLTLAGSNSISGPTTVAAGNLNLASASLSDAATVSIASGAVLNLAHGAVDDVATLKFNNIAQRAGSFNATNSGGYITGSGSIRVPLSEVRSDAYRDAAAGGLVTVRGRIFASDATQRAQMQPRLQVRDGGGAVVLDLLESGTSLTEAMWSFDATPLAPGAYTLRVTVLSANGVAVSVERPFQRLAQPIARTVSFDPQGRTLVNGQRFFPLGTYWSSISNADLATYQDSPFNCIMPYGSMDGTVSAQTANLDACQAAGIKVIYSVKDTFAGEYYATNAAAGEAALLAAVAAHKDHPALLAWYLADEEPITNLDEMRLHYQLVRNADTNHPCWEVFYQTDLVERSGSYDVLGTDPYPVVDHSDSAIYQSQRINYPLKMARLTADASRPGPTWMVPQAHNLACYGLTGVPPTRDEMRSMAWQCIAGGANGLVFYSFFDLQRDPAATFAARWTDLKAVGQEIKNLEAMLLADPAPAGRVSAPSNDDVGWRAYLLNGDVCLVAVNATRTNNSASFALDRTMYATALLGRSVSGGSSTNLTLDLQPLEVRVVRLSTNNNIIAAITNATTSLEANLAAGTANGGNPNSSAWWFGTNYFACYGQVTAADWNSGTSTFNNRAGAILQWNLSGFTNAGDTIGTVSSASFTIMGKQASNNTYKVYRLQAPITGATTWNTKPQLDTNAYVSFTMAADYALQTIDVSSLLARNGSLTNFGVAVLVDSISQAGDSHFWSTAYNQWPAYTSQNKLSASYTVNSTGPSLNPTNIICSVSGGQLTLSWPADHLGWTLQSQTNTLTGTWYPVSGSTATNSMTVPVNPANPAVFYRLKY